MKINQRKDKGYSCSEENLWKSCLFSMTEQHIANQALITTARVQLRILPQDGGTNGVKPLLWGFLEVPHHKETA